MFCFLLQDWEYGIRRNFYYIYMNGRMYVFREKAVIGTIASYHLLKIWSVCILQALSVVFTIIPYLSHLIGKELRQTPRITPEDCFSPKAKALLLRMTSLYLQAPIICGHLCPSIDTWIPKGDRRKISQLIKNFLETFWPNVLILQNKCQEPRQVTGQVQSDSEQVTKWGQDSTLYFSTLGLPSGQRPNFTPLCLSAEQDDSPCFQVKSHTEQSLGSPSQQESVCHRDTHRVDEAAERCFHYRATWLWQRHQSLRKMLPGSYRSQHLLFSGDAQMWESRKDRAETSLERQGCAIKHPDLGLGLWSLTWDRALHLIQIKRKCLRSVYSAFHILPSSMTQCLK